MQTSDLYKLAADHGHVIHELRLSESPAFCVEEDGVCHIALSDRLTPQEKKVMLAHELGHPEYGGFYNIYSPFALRSKTEAKAQRWAFYHAIPPDEIREALKKGIREVWELAEYFNVTEQFMNDGLRYYTEQIGIDFSDGLEW